MPYVVLGGLVLKKLVDVLRYARGRHLNGVLTQLVAWGGGVAATFATSAVAVLGQAHLNGVALTDLSGVAKIFLGIAAASVGSHVADLHAVLDRYDSSLKPPLVPPAAARPAA